MNVRCAFLLGVSLLTLVAGCAAESSDDSESGTGSALSGSDAGSAEYMIYGILTTEDHKPVDGTLTLTCAHATGTTTTIPGSGGTYRLFVKDKGRCHLVVNDMAQPGELVFVFDEGTQYNYVVKGTGADMQLERR